MGWSYDFWLGNFYPVNLSPSDFLVFYSDHFKTVEIDSTFYRTPSKSTVKSWGVKTPEDFIFTAKFPRTVTHEKLLVDCDQETRFFIQMISTLGEKLGPLLLQFPYSFKPEKIELLENFLKALPKEHRYAVEIKNRAWLHEGFYDLLRRNDVALALVDHPWLPDMDIVTSDFTYIRWEGDRKKIKGTTGKLERDRDKDLKEWAVKIENLLHNSIEVFGFFSKDYGGHSPSNVKNLLELLEN